MILCGARHTEDIADGLLGRGDLYVAVAADWLSDSPSDQLRKQANVAARQVAAHRLDTSRLS